MSIHHIIIKQPNKIKGICSSSSMTEARENLGLETLSDSRKSARMSLLMKIIADDTESSAVIRDSLSEFFTNPHDHYTRSLSHLCLLLYSLIYSFFITALFRGRLGT